MKKKNNSGFSLFELLLVMAISSLIILLLANVLSSALNEWQRGSDHAHLSKQVDILMDRIAGDLESIVVRSGNSHEWLTATSDPAINENGIEFNRTRIIFFSAPTDRYNGERNTGAGDISCVAYEGAWLDPISGNDASANFGVYRRIINPDETYKDLLGKADLLTAFEALDGNTTDAINLLTDNIIDFTLTFEIAYNDDGMMVLRLFAFPCRY